MRATFFLSLCLGGMSSDIQLVEPLRQSHGPIHVAPVPYTTPTPTLLGSAQIQALESNQALVRVQGEDLALGVAVANPRELGDV